MNYLDNAKRLIAERTPEPENKIIEQVRFNSYTLLRVRNQLERLYDLDIKLSASQDSWVKQEIASCKEQIQDLKQAIALLQKAFLENT